MEMMRGCSTMNLLIGSLKAFCLKYTYQRKMLIVPSYRAGNELRETLARDAGGFVNLYAETVDGLARKAAAVYVAQNGLSLFSSGQAAIAFENVYRQLDGSGALSYFSSKGTSEGLVGAIAAAVLELRSHGIAGENINTGSFVSPEKGRDVKQLLCAYERYLDEKNCIDPPGLLSIATDLPADPEATFYLIPPFLRLNPLEVEFINRRVPVERLFILQDESLPGMAPPPGTPTALFPGRLLDRGEYNDSLRETDAGLLVMPMQPRIPTGRREDRFTWHRGDVKFLDPELAHRQLAPDSRRDYIDEEDAIPVGEDIIPDDDGDLTIFHAYGMTNEAREVLRRIIDMRVSLDAVTVAYTRSEYVPVFHSLCKRYGITLTAAEGVPASLTRPGKALKGIVEWVKSDFATIVPRQLLIEGSISLRTEKGDQEIPPLEAAELLRASGIGWGRERYSLLAAYSERTRDEIAGMDAGNRLQTSLQNKMTLASQLNEMLQGILALVPEPDPSGRVSFGNFTAAMASILSRLASVGDEMDARTLEALLAHLGEIAQLASFSLGFEDALDRVEEIADGLSVGASSPKPGAFHLVSYRNLHWAGRPFTFMVGLDANSFPGGVAQDPVLLDSERQLLHPELALGRDRPRLRQYEMLTALSSRRGRVVLGFPSFDVTENRDNLPSSLLLQAFRLIKRDPSLDYSDLQRWLGSPAGYNPFDKGQALDETEWWIKQTLVRRLANGPALVRQCYRSVEGGQAALAARQAGAPTEYDGVVVAAGDDLRLRNHPTLSCSRIEYLAGCPFAYFLRYVLYLNPPEDVVHNPGRWLDPLQRGLLLHELYCKFMKEIVRRKQRVSVAAHRNLMYEMADELITGYKATTPPPSEMVFNREVRDIRDSCDVFLVTEESETESTPVFFEVPFGMSGKMPDREMGARDPVRIDFESGLSFALRGQIDRIDRVNRDVYRIWDYKTGSARGYEDHQYLYRGRQVQHALYAIAAEKFIKDRLGGHPRVEWSGYYFPTRKGDGRRVVRNESDRSLIAGLMAHLFNILHGGTFVATDDGEACGYCDYAEVCDPEQAVSRAKALVAGATSSCLNPWRRLKDFA